MARYSRTRDRCSHVMVLYYPISCFFSGLYRGFAYRAHGWGRHDMDACSNERAKSIATGAIPARHGSHEHTAAGRRRDWNSGCNQYPFGRYGEIFARLLSSSQTGRNGKRNNGWITKCVLVRDDHSTDWFGHSVLHPPRRSQPQGDEFTTLMFL